MGVQGPGAEAVAVVPFDLLDRAGGEVDALQAAAELARIGSDIERAGADDAHRVRRGLADPGDLPLEARPQARSFSPFTPSWLAQWAQQ